MNILIYTGTFQLFLVGIFANENLIVSLKDGLIKGRYKESYDGRKFIAFDGIPYARPPIGDLRFEDPQPVEAWPGILEATQSYMCLQYDFYLAQDIAGHEDCLYLNVYVPREKINPDEKLDVIVHIHGGGYILGTPGYAEPEKLMDRDVIYVNFNFRLGPLGFYSIGDGRGNYGMKDQTAVLKWIQDNIEKFGGNKDSVTLIGMSSGGACVHLHYMSNLSRGLFHKGFSQSGMPLSPWAFKRNPTPNAIRLADDVGCSDLTGNDIYACMKERSANQIIRASLNLFEEAFLPMAIFGPVVEENSPTSFLTKLPYSYLIDKEVSDLPLLVSMTEKEGTSPAIWMYTRTDELNASWKRFSPLLFGYHDLEQEKRDEVSEKIKKFYFNDEPITTENFKILIEACTHRVFHIGGEKSAVLQAKASLSNVYFMLISYVGEFVPVPSIPGLDINWGAGHGADSKYYYNGVQMPGLTLTEDERRMRDILLDMLVSFAKTGDPNTDAFNILPLSKADETFSYLLVDSPDDLHMERKSLGPHEFWSSLGLEEDENA